VVAADPLTLAKRQLAALAAVNIWFSVALSVVSTKVVNEVAAGRVRDYREIEMSIDRFYARNKDGKWIKINQAELSHSSTDCWVDISHGATA
jgi:hypothetical protein